MQKPLEPFVVKHYTSEERPSIKGNGFDGLEVGETREEAEEFVVFINSVIASLRNTPPERDRRLAYAEEFMRRKRLERKQRGGA